MQIELTLLSMLSHKQPSKLAFEMRPLQISNGF